MVADVFLQGNHRVARGCVKNVKAQQFARMKKKPGKRRALSNMMTL